MKNSLAANTQTRMMTAKANTNHEGHLPYKHRIKVKIKLKVKSLNYSATTQTKFLHPRKNQWIKQTHEQTLKCRLLLTSLKLHQTMQIKCKINQLTNSYIVFLRRNITMKMGKITSLYMSKCTLDMG